MELSAKLQTELNQTPSELKGDSRRLLYALIRSQLNEYRDDCNKSILSTVGELTLQCFIAASTGLVFFLLIWLILPSVLFDWGIFFIIFIIGSIAYKAKSVTESSRIRLTMDSVEDGQAEKRVLDRLVLGQVESILNNRMISFLSMTMGFALAIQTAMVWLHSGHMGYAVDITFMKSFFISLDNLLHGVCLDTFEIYGLTIGQSVESLPFVYKSFVFIFRLIYDACFLTIGFLLFKRFQMKALIMKIPSNPTMQQFKGWMASVTQSQTGWLSSYTEETMFIVISNHYIHQRHQEVKILAESFKHLSVSNPVRGLFIDDETSKQLWPKN